MGSTETAVPAASKILFGSFVTTGPVTIRRVRGLVNWRTDQSVATEAPEGAIGLCVVTEDAFAAGVASLPGPLSDAGSEVWLMHQFLFAAFLHSDNTGWSADAGHQYEIDSKAMRKFSLEQRVAIVIENGHATAGALAWIALRALASPSYG